MAPARVERSFASLPVSFEPNAGQAPADVDYVARGPASALLTPTGAVLTGGPEPVTLTFVGASRSAHGVGTSELPGKANYLRGNDPARWRTNLPTYATVRYEQIYRAIDLVYYGGRGGLEYDLIVAPGADVGAISFELEGAPPPQLDTDGALVAGGVRLEPPVAYQVVDAVRRPVASHYVVRDGRRAAFEVGAYDPALPLVVDPEIGYMFGFAESGKDIQVNGVAVDPTGAAYVVGRFKSAGAGGVLTISVYVAKLNPEGTALVYSTMLGGGDLDEGRAIAVDDAGNVFITGLTYSGDFPTTAGAFQTTNPQPERIDAFVTKIGADGDTLVYSSYLGGGDVEVGKAIAIDAAGNAYVTGNTESSNFPTTAAAQSTYGGALDAFVTKVNPTGTAKLYSTYLGGSGGDPGSGIAVDAAGNAYVVGETDSSNFPVSPGALQTTRSAPRDAFWAKYDASGQRVASTYLGGSDFDRANAVAVDAAGNSYVTGETQSSDFPLASPVQSALAGNFDLFVAELNPTGTALVFSTFYGGTQFETGHAIIVDDSGLVYVVGDTYSSDFPTVDRVQPAYGGGISDSLVLQLAPGASARGGGGVLFASNFGGPRTEFGVGGALGPDGALVTGTFLPNLSSGGENEEGQVTLFTFGPPPPRPDLSVSILTGYEAALTNIFVGLVLRVENLDTCGAGAAPAGATFTVDVPPGFEVDDARGVDADVTVDVMQPSGSNGGSVTFTRSSAIAPGEVVLCVVRLKTSRDAPGVARLVEASIAPGDCKSDNNLASAYIDPKRAFTNDGSFIIINGPKEIFDQTSNSTVAPGIIIVTGKFDQRTEQAGPAAKVAGRRGFNVYSSTQPNVQPTPANLFTTVPPNLSTIDVSGAPAGSFFVVTAVTDAGESGPSNEVGGVLPTITKLKVSSSKIVAQGTGFATDVKVFFAGVPFSTAAKLKKANSKVVQKGALVTGQSIGTFAAQVLPPGATTTILFLNGNGNAVAVEYAP